MSIATKRLQKEAVTLEREPPQHIRARPLENDIFVFHYVIEGPKGSPFEGGYYHGVLKFPAEYPLKPPAVMMYTPNGRFAVAQRICLSMSDYHPETWNPVWSVGTILVGLLSFMLESTDTVGSVKTSDETKRKFATESLEFNLTNKEFVKLFPELVELAEQKRRETSRLQALAGGISSAPSGTSGQAGQGNRGGATDWCQSLLLLVVLLAVVLGMLRKTGSQAPS